MALGMVTTFRTELHYCDWLASNNAIFPSTIDGDIVKLVHLFNGFRMIPGSK